MDRITFIGGGNMAATILGGLIADGTAPTGITVVDPNSDQRAALKARNGIMVTDDVEACCSDAETIVLAVKPQAIATVAAQMGGNLGSKLIISIAAGVTIATLEQHFGPIAIARTMPNTPALLGLGATGVSFNTQTTKKQKATANAIAEAFSICVEVSEEALLDVVTAVSGSGPAYYFLMIEEMIRAGIALGLPPETAADLTVQTALGAATMAAKGDAAPWMLRARVTSPNGTTHAAIASLQESGFGDVIARAMTACRDRGAELGKAE